MPNRAHNKYMADEAVFLNVSELDNRSVTWSDSSTVLKGTLIVLARDPNIGDIHRSIQTIPLGFAVADKAASDGQTEIGVKVRGDVDAIADGAITLGDLVEVSGVINRVKTVTAGTLSGTGLRYMLGRCLETASDGERVRIRLMLG